MASDWYFAADRLESPEDARFVEADLGGLRMLGPAKARNQRVCICGQTASNFLRQVSQARERTVLFLYGNPRSRAMRCLWMLEEMGAPYQLIQKSTRAEDLQSAEYLRLNPNARIPTLLDGDLVLWESMAINLYLAQRYEGPMHCAKAEGLGLAAQWSFWAILEMEALVLELLQHRALLPEFVRDPSYAERDELLLKRPLTVLNARLAEKGFLVDDTFTVADLNVASILAWGKMARLNLSEQPNIGRWLDNCLSRPGYARLRALRGEN